MTPWYKAEGESLGSEVDALVSSLLATDAPRRERMRLSLQRYAQGRSVALGALGAWAGTETKGGYLEGALPLYPALVDTVVADIAGRQRPKAQVMTSGGDWQSVRRAKRLDYFAEGCLHQQPPALRYVNGWDVAVDVLRDCVKTGEGVWGVTITEDGRVEYERVYPEEVVVDPVEAYHGVPRSFHRVRYAAPETLLALFTDDDMSSEERDRIKAGIYAAGTSAYTVDDSDPTAYVQERRQQQRVRYIESWHICEENGLHCFTVPNCVLHREDYTLPRPPFSFSWWSPLSRGWGGQGLIEQAAGIVDDTLDSADRIAERVRLCSGRRTFYVAGSVKPEALEANDAETLVEIEPGTQYPSESVVPPFTPAEFQWLQWMVQQSFALTGVSMMSATAQKDPGVTSAIGMRTMQDVATKRLAIQARFCYEYMFVDVAKLTFLLAQDWTKRTGRKLRVSLPGRKEIDFGDAALDEDFAVRVNPASALQGEAAGTISTAEQLVTTGLIDPATFKRVLHWLDLDRELERENTEYAYLEDLLDRYLDAEEATFDRMTEWETPDSYLTQKERALMQCATTYFEARRLGAPDFNLQLLRDYMQQLDKMIASAAAATQAATAPPTDMAAPPMAAGDPALGAP